MITRQKRGGGVLFKKKKTKPFLRVVLVKEVWRKTRDLFLITDFIQSLVWPESFVLKSRSRPLSVAEEWEKPRLDRGPY